MKRPTRMWAELRLLLRLIVASRLLAVASSAADCLTAPTVGNVLSVSAPVASVTGGGSYALYTCNVGYEFWSADASAYNRTCTAAGGWEPLSDCQPVHCPALPSDAATSLSTSESTYGTAVDVSCQPTYQVVGLPPGQSLRLSCQANKEWSSAVGASLCVSVRCTHPAIANASWSENATYAAVLTSSNYTCQPGFFFPGDVTSQIFTCSSVGSWQPTGVVCEPVHCPALTIANGYVDLPNSTVYGSVVVVSCLKGYQFSDGAVSPALSCRSDRTWTPLTGQCTPLVCPTPPSPAHTTHDINSSLTYGSVLNYSCDSGYLFADRASWRLSECGAQSLWSPVVPACLPADSLPQPGVKYVEQQVEAANAESISSLPLGIAGTVFAILFILDVITFPIQLAYVKKNLKAFADSLKRPEPEPEPQLPVFSFPSVISLGRGRVTPAPSVADLGFVRDDRGDWGGSKTLDGEKAQFVNFSLDEIKRKASVADLDDSRPPVPPPAPAAVHGRAQPPKSTGPIDVAAKKERLKSAKRSVQQAIELAVFANNLSRGGGGTASGGGSGGGRHAARSNAFVPNILPLHSDNVGATRGSISIAIDGFENEVEHSEESTDDSDDDEDDGSDEDDKKQEERTPNDKSSIPGQVTTT